jgi:hypothetical protein
VSLTCESCPDAATIALKPTTPSVADAVCGSAVGEVELLPAAMVERARQPLYPSTEATLRALEPRAEVGSYSFGPDDYHPNKKA